MIIRKILKWFIPDAKDVTPIISQVVADTINGSGKEEVIAKYATMADRWSEAQKYITGWLRDGRIDEYEQIQFENAITPLVEKVIILIKERL